MKLAAQICPTFETPTGPELCFMSFQSSGFSRQEWPSELPSLLQGTFPTRDGNLGFLRHCRRASLWSKPIERPICIHEYKLLKAPTSWSYAVQPVSSPPADDNYFFFKVDGRDKTNVFPTFILKIKRQENYKTIFICIMEY